MVTGQAEQMAPDTERSLISGPVSVAIVLTATVNPTKWAGVQREDPATRLSDYERALRLWLRETSIQKIIFCENSGADLTSLIKIAENANPLGKQIEFHTYREAESNENKGKGYGEIGILDYVCRSSVLAQSATHLIKMTGRLYVPNISKLTYAMQQDPGTFVFCTIGMYLRYAQVRVFGAHKEFFTDYLIRLRPKCNDSLGVNMEFTVARAVHLAMADGLRWHNMPMVPDVHGYSGTLNVAYRRRLLSQILGELSRRLKEFLLIR